MMTAPELGIELGNGLEIVARCLRRRQRDSRRAATAGRRATSSRYHREIALRPYRGVAHTGIIRIFDFAVLDFLHARKTLLHDQHVRGNDGFAESAELLLILLLYGSKKGFVTD